MKNRTIKKRDKTKIHILVSNCPSKTVGEEESKERREEEEEEGRGEEEDQRFRYVFALKSWVFGFLRFGLENCSSFV